MQLMDEGNQFILLIYTQKTRWKKPFHNSATHVILLSIQYLIVKAEKRSRADFNLPNQKEFVKFFIF